MGSETEPSWEELECKAEQRETNRLWVHFGDALSRVQNRGARVATGFPTVDDYFAGGPHPGSVTVVQGGPFTGKTLIATQICLEMAKTCAAGFLFADEGLPGSVLRIGQQLGGNKEKLEAGDKDETRLVMAELERREIHLINPDEREATVETFFEQLSKRATAGKPLVAMLDSIQVLRTNTMTTRMNETERVMLATEIIRKYALKLNAIAFVVAKMSRSGYRNKLDENNAEPMAAARGSSDVEYGIEALLSLHGNPEKKMELRCVKNRFGTKKAQFTVPLALDFPRARLLELDVHEVEAEQEIARDVRRLATVAKMKTRVLKEIQKATTAGAGLTKAALRQILPGRPADVLEAIDELYKANVIYPEERTGKKGGGMEWKAAQ